MILKPINLRAERSRCSGAKPLKLCFIQPKTLAYFQPERGLVRGGAERQIYHLSTSLASTPGLEVSVVVMDEGQGAFEHRGVSVIPGLRLEGSRCIEALKLLKTLRSLGADVYVLHAADLAVGVTGMMVKALGKKLMYMVANSTESDGAVLKEWCGPLGAKAMGWLYAHADAVLPQTLDQQTAFAEKRSIDGPLQPNMLVAPEQDPAQPRKDREGVLWVGRCDPLKRAERFIELAAQLPDVTFTMVCPPTHLKDYVERIAHLASLRKNLAFIDRALDSHELWQHYGKAQLLVMTSSSEGYSNVMMEALYSRTPLLTTDLDPDGILSGHGLGIVSNDSSLADHLLEGLNDPELLETMGARGRAFMMERHDPETCTRAFLASLEGVQSFR